MDARVDEQLKDLVDWIASSDAQQAAQRILRQRGLPAHGADDLRHDAFIRVEARLRRLGPIPLDAGKSIAAHVVTTMKNRATDMLRSRDRESKAFAYVVQAVKDEVDDAFVDAFDAEEEGVRDDLVDELRSELLAAAEGPAWPTSAALSFLTLAIDPERDDHLGPRPGSGLEDQWKYWTGLWLAGREDCFPNLPEIQDDDARRQRRARAIKQVKARIAKARESVPGLAPGFER